MGFFSDLFGGSDSTQSIAPFQQPFLHSLFIRGNEASKAAEAQSGQLFSAGQGFLGTLGSAGQGLSQFAQPGFAQQQIGAVQNLLNRNLTENLLPAIGSGAVQAGGFGGTRQGIAEGIALRGTQEALSNTSADILASDLLRRQSAQAQSEQLASAGAVGGLSQLPGLSTLGLNPLLALAQIIGQPIVLGQNKSSGGILPGIGSLSGFSNGAGLLGIF